MIDIPKTIEEAKKYTYGSWAGAPNGHRYKEGFCAYEISSGGGFHLFHQCGNKSGKGINGLFCGTHANKIIKRGK